MAGGIKKARKRADKASKKKREVDESTDVTSLTRTLPPPTTSCIVGEAQRLRWSEWLENEERSLNRLKDYFDGVRQMLVGCKDLGLCEKLVKCGLELVEEKNATNHSTCQRTIFFSASSLQYKSTVVTEWANMVRFWMEVAELFDETTAVPAAPALATATIKVCDGHIEAARVFVAAKHEEIIEEHQVFVAAKDEEIIEHQHAAAAAGVSGGGGNEARDDNIASAAISTSTSVEETPSTSSTLCSSSDTSAAADELYWTKWLATQARTSSTHPAHPLTVKPH